MARRRDRTPNLRISGRRDLFQERNRKAAPPWRLLIILVVAGTAIGVLHNRWRALHKPDPALGGVRVVTYPVQAIGKGTNDRSVGLWQSLTQGFALKSENDRLRRELSAAKIESERLAKGEAENIRLRALLKLPAVQAGKNITGSVVALLPSPYFETITVGRGTRDGVKDGWSVRTADGLVGQVTEASLLTSQVMLLTDFNSAVSVLIKHNGQIRARGLVKGAGRDQPLDLVFVQREAKIAVGDLLVSSGFGGVIPPDIPVGIITEINDNKSLLTKGGKVKGFAGLPGGIREVILLP